MPSPAQASFAQDVLDQRARLVLAEQGIMAPINQRLSSMFAAWRKELQDAINAGNAGQRGSEATLAELGRKAGILNELGRITKKDMAAVQAYLAPRVSGVYTSELHRQSYLYDNNLVKAAGQTGIAFGGLSERAAQAALVKSKIPGANLIKGLDKLTETTTARMRRDIAEGIAEGWSVDKLTDRWAKGVGAGALHRDVEALAITGLHAAANAASTTLYKANEHLIKGLLWSSALDSRVCVRCAAMQARGTIYPVDKPPPCPLHLRCRCILQPVFHDDNLNATAQMQAYRKADNTVAFRKADTGFDAWLKKQPAGIQDDFFPSRLKQQAWRSGVPLVDLVSEAGDPLSDAEVRDLLELRKIKPPAPRAAAAPAPNPKVVNPPPEKKPPAVVFDPMPEPQTKAAPAVPLPKPAPRPAPKPAAPPAAAPKILPRPDAGYENVLANRIAANDALAAERAAKEAAEANRPTAGLGSGKIKKVKDIGKGINGAKFIDFEDGTRAVYKPEEDVSDYILQNGYVNIYKREVAASKLDKFLGTNLVPETIEYDGPNGRGSLQAFLKNAKEAGDVTGVSYDDRFFAFDILLGNQDRHGGNAMVQIIEIPGVTKNERRLKAIDNGFTLLDNAKLSQSARRFRTPTEVEFNGFGEEAKAMASKVIDNQAELRKELADLLSDAEIDSIVERAEFILAQPSSAKNFGPVSDRFIAWIRGESNMRGWDYTPAEKAAAQAKIQERIVLSEKRAQAIQAENDRLAKLRREAKG